MMGMLRIALLQISPLGSAEKNMQKGITWCRKASQEGADIALFPEMWSNGYNIYDRPAEEWMAEAVPNDGSFVRAFQDTARDLGTVSYTHLDVYKRQPLLSLPRDGPVLRKVRRSGCSP